MVEKKTKKSTPEQKDKEEIFRAIYQEYQQAPDEMWSHYPEIAAKLERFCQPKRPSSAADRLSYPYLTERERAFHVSRLVAIVEKFKSGPISKEEALTALEDAAALREQAAPHKETLLRLLKKELGFPLDTPEEKTVIFQKGKPEHHTFKLARGITLSLTWNGKIIKIVFDPKEFAYRQRMLSFVGVASDTKTDVARRHDDYLDDAFGS